MEIKAKSIGDDYLFSINNLIKKIEKIKESGKSMISIKVPDSDPFFDDYTIDKMTLHAYSESDIVKIKEDFTKGLVMVGMIGEHAFGDRKMTIQEFQHKTKMNNVEEFMKMGRCRKRFITKEYTIENLTLKKTEGDPNYILYEFKQPNEEDYAFHQKYRMGL